jgi:hypothetical protein
MRAYAARPCWLSRRVIDDLGDHTPRVIQGPKCLALESLVIIVDTIYILMSHNALHCLARARDLRAARATEQSKSPHDAGANFFVFRLGVAVALELGRLAQERATEPGTVSLPLVTDDLHVQTA